MSNDSLNMKVRVAGVDLHPLGTCIGNTCSCRIQPDNLPSDVSVKVRIAQEGGWMLQPYYGQEYMSINDQPLPSKEDVLLQDGDVVRVGSEVFTFRMND